MIVTRWNPPTHVALVLVALVGGCKPSTSEEAEPAFRPPALAINRSPSPLQRALADEGCGGIVEPER